ncbi:MAG: hypothetical protein M3457_09780 [Chloroflexota bacterium]|nr:hypothetical protein [Chloroflexota bacterium]
MTKTRSNRGRHRRNRDRAPETIAPGSAPVEVPAEQPSQPAPAQRPQGPERSAVRDQVPNRRAGGGPPGPQGTRGPQERSPPERGQSSGAGDQGAGQRFGQARGNRRRPPRRPQSVPMPNQVLRSKAPVTGPTGPVAKRHLEDISGPEGPVLGCPMLTRTRIGLPVTGGQRAPRCSLAWAIHSETEATYCMETHDLTQCWQAHPERLDEVKARLDEQRAAD